jgi:hypothetical protein
MNTRIRQLACVGALLFLQLSAHGLATYSDADYFGGTSWLFSTPKGQTVGPGGSIDGTFNFVSNDGTSEFNILLPYGILQWDHYESQLGFTPGFDTVVPGSGFMKFFIREGTRDLEVITLSLADMSFQSSVFNSSIILTSGLSATVEGSINAFGEVAYSISSNSGSFIVDAAYMEFTARSSPSASYPVPDGGGTLILMGIALVGIAAIHSKFAF